MFPFVYAWYPFVHSCAPACSTEFLRIRNAEEQLNLQREQLEASRKMANKASRQMASGPGGGRAKRGGGGGGRATAAAAAAAAAAPGDESGSGDEDAGANAVLEEFSFLDADAQANLASLTAAAPRPASSASASTAAASFADPLAALDRSVRDEALRQSLGLVRTELAALADRRRSLDPERALLLLELNRHKNEAASKWRGLPCIGRESIAQYQLLQLLGRGGFSEVWRAMDLAAGREVAVKLHQLQEHWPREKRENFVRHALRESTIQFDMRHPNIVLL